MFKNPPQRYMPIFKGTTTRLCLVTGARGGAINMKTKYKICIAVLVGATIGVLAYLLEGHIKQSYFPICQE
jgi:hypothetical protein